MTDAYLIDLDRELTTAGIPRRRRARIIAEFADHLLQGPDADLGPPAALARQFADELGTRLARVTAYRAVAALAIAGLVLTGMFVEGGRTWGGWGGYGSYRISDYIPSWWVPVLAVCVLAGQIALASGLLALIRAWRLRRQPVITAADAKILNRRAAVGLVAGAVTLLLLPATDLMLARPLDYRLPGGGIEAQTERWQPLLSVPPARWWDLVALIGGPVLILGLLSLLPEVLRAARLRPTLDGAAGDLASDFGMANNTRATPARLATILASTIFVALAVYGIATSDPIDGLLRGLLDAAACLTGFGLLGRYLGLRSAPSAGNRPARIDGTA